MLFRSYFAFLFAAGCGSRGGLVVEVSNPSELARSKETVEIAWEELDGAGLTPDNVVVLSPEGGQEPSQVLFDDAGRPSALLFQATVGAGATAEYPVRRGMREEYERKAYGRYVPERADDYAWENNLTAYRIYGPALGDPRTQGVDVWVKSAPRLIIDEWFARNDYHRDYGEGMDCYKVGNTLGGGALAPFVDGRVALAGNYVSQECTANGPIRTEARFVYAPVDIGGRKVTMRRTIRLDADDRFTVQEYVLDGFDGELPVAAGLVLHEVKASAEGRDRIAVTEAASDSSDPERDGDISLGVILAGGEGVTYADGHALVTRRAKAGEKIVMLNGSGWSRAGVDDAEEWRRAVEERAEALAAPLNARVKRN